MCRLVISVIRVYGLGLWIYGLWFMVYGLGFRVGVQGLGFKVWG